MEKNINKALVLEPWAGESHGHMGAGAEERARRPRRASEGFTHAPKAGAQVDRTHILARYATVVVGLDRGPTPPMAPPR